MIFKFFHVLHMQVLLQRPVVKMIFFGVKFIFLQILLKLILIFTASETRTVIFFIVYIHVNGNIT